MFGVTKSARQTRKPTGKHPGGRPSEFKSEYCQRVKDFMGKGYSLTAFAGEIGVSRETIYEWERVKPEFSDAIKRARSGRVRALEEKLFSGEDGASPASVIFALKNACPDEWRKEQPEMAVTVNNEVRIDPSKQPEDWSQAEIEAELKRRNAPLPVPIHHNGHKPKGRA